MLKTFQKRAFQKCCKESYSETIGKLISAIAKVNSNQEIFFVFRFSRPHTRASDLSKAPRLPICLAPAHYTFHRRQ